MIGDVGGLPAPSVSREMLSFWERIRPGEFPLQLCESCGRHQYYPRTMCRYCHSRDLTFVAHAGTGFVVSSTVVHSPPSVVFADVVPYVVCLVELDDTEGVKVLSNLRDPRTGEPVDPDPGTRVVATAVPRGDSLIHQFDLVGQTAMPTLRGDRS